MSRLWGEAGSSGGRVWSVVSACAAFTGRVMHCLHSCLIISPGGHRLLSFEVQGWSRGSIAHCGQWLPAELALSHTPISIPLPVDLLF